ncbi:MAG TPA: CpsB/CapC family capsule biosynthesis tyrosine phosphatase [Gaiellaceae bacterium]|nr:CpsB/CapC family capsule biosynthesis tyrosine phosphatase [Gaiellaceae bacterium]
MIDLHSHILPGLDDGSRTVEDARALARRALEEGVTAIAATPHVRADYPTRPEEMERGVRLLREDFVAQGIQLEVLHGGEIDLVMLGSLDDDAVRRFSLARSERYLLLEFPYTGWPAGLEETVYALGLRGFVPILAHPERNRETQRDPGRLEEAVRMGALVQLTAASVEGRIGRSAQRAAGQLLDAGIAHLLASDAHTPEIREAGLAGAAEAVGDERLAAYLTVEAPGAIVAGEAVPAPPSRARRRRFLLF